MNNTRVTVVWIDQSDDRGVSSEVETVTYDVRLSTAEQFFQLKVNNKPITVVAPDKTFADHPDGGSMIPLVRGGVIALVAGQARPKLNRISFVPMKHNSGRMTLIKPDKRSFALV